MIFDILCFNFRNTLLTECWRKDPDHRPEPVKILELLSAHPAMVTACLDSPMSSVVRDEEDCVRPDSIRKGSVRSWRGTPSPSPITFFGVFFYRINRQCMTFSVAVRSSLAQILRRV